MTAEERRVLFLPGASGDGRFWGPVADQLPATVDAALLDWPGLGHVPASPEVRGLDDLVGIVLRQLDGGPASLVAQSMGGVVAVMAALARPDRVERLVLAATSGGIDLAPFQPADWREEYAREFPGAAARIRDVRVDLTDQLPSLQVPTLLLWSDGDPISPVAVGRRLARLLPRAELLVVPGWDHMFARDHAGLVAPAIVRHLRGPTVG